MFLRTAGKSALVVAGFGYGLSRGLRALWASGESAAHTALSARVDTIQLAVARLGDQSDRLQSRLERGVTRDEVSEALDRAFGQLQSGVEARFEQEARSVQALRAMIRQTDEMLRRVLDRMDAIGNNMGSNQAGPAATSINKTD